ncbi:MAG: DUF4837 family protein [Bacteroidales bacterium]|nr:DUF4837 family protein [Bacteroidales bacterium]
MKAYKALLLATLLLTGCKSGETILPAISGKAGEVAIVSSKTEWETEPGSTLRTILGESFPFLPQAEPMYDLFNVPPQAFNKLFKVHRNIIYIDTEATYSESKVHILKDVWATPQVVIRIEAPNADEARRMVEENIPLIISALEKAERDRVISNAKAYENPQVRAAVHEMISGSPYFPKGYTLKKADDNFLWIACETNFTIQGILIWKYPYISSMQLTPVALAAMRDEVTKAQIPCTTENSYMILNPVLEPDFRTLQYNKREFVEMRGLWEAYNDFMGGPCVSHTFFSRDGSELITMDAFVYAPKYNKREYLKQVEALLYSFEWDNPVGKQ